MYSSTNHLNYAFLKNYILLLKLECAMSYNLFLNILCLFDDVKQQKGIYISYFWLVKI